MTESEYMDKKAEAEANATLARWEREDKESTLWWRICNRMSKDDKIRIFAIVLTTIAVIASLPLQKVMWKAWIQWVMK